MAAFKIKGNPKSCLGWTIRRVLMFWNTLGIGNSALNIWKSTGVNSNCTIFRLFTFDFMLCSETASSFWQQ